MQPAPDRGDPLPVGARFPRDLSLRDGRTVRLRRARGADGPALFDLEQAIVAAGQGVVLLHEELERATTLQRLGSFLTRPDDLLLVAEVGRDLVGTIDIRRLPRRMIRHNGVLSMGVHPGWQGAGGGRAAGGAVRPCRQRASICGFFGSLFWNGWATPEGDVPPSVAHRGQALYRAAGFRERWRRERFLRRESGTWGDDVAMSWEAPEG